MTTQGRATHSGSGSTKTEPRPQIVNPAAVARLGTMQGNHSDRGTHRVTKVPMYEGRGLSAPSAKCTVHPKGSQR